ncbi:MAG: CsiV family protein [Steroidobacteraceae bacterium]
MKGRTLVALLVLLLVAVPAIPQDGTAPNVYNVEIIVLKNGGGGGEDWAVRTPLRGGDKSGEQFVGRFVATVPASQYQLNDLEARIAAAGNGVQPIAHFAWQQTASAWGSRAGFTVERLAGNVPGLSGRIFLERGQYLHLGMSLNYTQGGTIFNLSEIRRIRFFQRNYYDHPVFGVIALVTPVKKGPPGR